jgi:hypothetical protein
MKGQIFHTKESLEQHIRQWVRLNLGTSTKIKIAWWQGIYLPSFGSIFPIGTVPTYKSRLPRVCV